jgi:cysteine desulfurase
MNVSLLSIAGHKLYAPKGVGAIYVKDGIVLEKLIHGADHEMNRRAGTENVLEIVGLDKACEMAKRDLVKNMDHLKSMREMFCNAITEKLPDVKLNGHPVHRLPNTLSLSFKNAEANNLLASMPKIAASAGAACHTGSVKVSTVLEAMKVPLEFAKGTIRFSIGKYTTAKDLEMAASIVIREIQKQNH